MAIRHLPLFSENLLVIGPMYGNIPNVDLSLYDYVIFNDGITYSQKDLSLKISAMNKLLHTGRVIYNTGNIDLSTANSMDILQPEQLQTAEWILQQPNIIIVDFNKSFQIIIVSGGIPSYITYLDQLSNNIEASFITHPHETYTGGLGYVITNLPYTQSSPTYYRYSTQLGSNSKDKIWGVEVTKNGIRRKILL